MSRAPGVAVVVVAFGLLLSDVKCQKYEVPEATVEILKPRGIKISIPDFVEHISLVAFHVNINEEFQTLAHGHYAQDVVKKKDGRWTYHIPLIKPKQGDVIYYWIYAIIEGLGYHALDKSYTVTEGSPPPPPPVTPDRIPDPSGPCQSSSSTKNRQGGLCRGQIMLHKTFDNLDGWSYEVFIGGSHLYVHCNEVKEDATTPKEEGETDSACLLIPEDKEVRKLKIEQLRLTNENLEKDSYYKSLQILQLERALKTRNSDYTSHLVDG
uniref:CBM39 domain-containing protein n=1 Tax=Homalodisca liturata TaxID=320908 RepID=A0A1B6IZB5_9HEMI